MSDGEQADLAGRKELVESPKAELVKRPGWKVKLRRFVCFLVIMYVGVCVLLTVFQKYFVYFPLREIEQTPAELGLAYEDVWLTSAGDVKIHGWFIPARDSRGTLLFFHGNGGNISRRLESIYIFHDLGLDVLIIDYQGYGRSEGKPGEENTYADAEAAWDYLTNTRGIASERIIIFGRSLGGAVATYLAERHTPGALILESTFTSIPDIGAKKLPFLPVRWLCRIKYNSLQRIGQVRCPILSIHSPQDNLIAYEFGEKLFQAAPEPKRFLQIEGDHNSGFMQSLPKYREGLKNFLADYSF